MPASWKCGSEYSWWFFYEGIKNVPLSTQKSLYLPVRLAGWIMGYGYLSNKYESYRINLYLLITFNNRIALILNKLGLAKPFPCLFFNLGQNSI
jgi:hypothetical protein